VWLVAWPVLLPVWLWGKGLAGQVLAGLFVLFLLVVGSVLTAPGAVRERAAAQRAMAAQTTAVLPTVAPEVVPAAMPVWTATPVSVAAAVVVRLSLADRLQQAIGGESNRVEVDTLLDVVNVRWALNENVSTASTVTGAWMDVARMLQAIHGSGQDYSLINFAGTLVLTDGSGNQAGSPVFWASFSRAAVETVNWADVVWVESVLYRRLPEMAESQKLHPALQE